MKPQAGVTQETRFLFPLSIHTDLSKGEVDPVPFGLAVTAVSHTRLQDLPIQWLGHASIKTGDLEQLLSWLMLNGSPAPRIRFNRESMRYAGAPNEHLLTEVQKACLGLRLACGRAGFEEELAAADEVSRMSVDRDLAECRRQIALQAPKVEELKTIYSTMKARFLDRWRIASPWDSDFMPTVTERYFEASEEWGPIREARQALTSSLARVSALESKAQELAEKLESGSYRYNGAQFINERMRRVVGSYIGHDDGPGVYIEDLTGRPEIVSAFADYQIPFGCSPATDSEPLSELMRRATQAWVGHALVPLVPLSAGAYGATNAIMTNQLVVAIEIAGVSAVVSFIFAAASLALSLTRRMVKEAEAESAVTTPGHDGHDRSPAANRARPRDQAPDS